MTHAVADHLRAAARDQLQRQRIEACSTLSTRAASVSGVVARPDRHGPLRDDRPGVHFRRGRNAPSRRARCTPAASARSCVFKSREERQQGRVDIEDPVAPRSTNAVDSSRMKPARQISSIPASRRAASSSASNSTLACRTLAVDRQSRSRSSCRGRSPRPAASGRSETTRAISAGKFFASAAASSAARLLPRPEISTAVFACAQPSKSSSPAENRSRSSSARRDAGRSRKPSRHALRAPSARRASGATFDDEHHADPAIEGAQHLRLLRPARRASGRPAAQRIAARSISAARCAGSTRGTFSTSPPPVMWASALTAPVSRIAARHARDIDARRRRAAPRRASCLQRRAPDRTS